MGVNSMTKQKYTNMDKQELGKYWDAKTGETGSTKCKEVPGPGVNEGQRMFLDGYKFFDHEGKPIIPSTVKDDLYDKSSRRKWIRYTLRSISSRISESIVTPFWKEGVDKK
jgi:hypothetical protein